MAFVLRRPFAFSSSLSTTARQLSKSAATRTAPVRAFHQTPLKSSQNHLFTSRTTVVASSPAKYQNVFQNAFRRSYMQQPYQVSRPDTAGLGQKLLWGAAIIGGTMVVTNVLFNRETREDGGMPPFERSYLNETFLHTGLGIGIIGLAARTLHQSGWSYRLMAYNPWAVMGVSLVASIGTMYATFATPPEK